MGRIEVRLDENTHEDWREHVERDSRYKTMTQLIRYAVGEQIQRDRGEKGSAESIDPNAIEQAVDNSLDSFRNEMQSMRNDIVQTQRVVESSINEEYHLDNAIEFHDILPKVPSITEALSVSNSGRVSELEKEFREEVNQDISSSDVRIALARLENEVPQVHSEIVDEERVYYEES